MTPLRLLPSFCRRRGPQTGEPVDSTPLRTGFPGDFGTNYVGPVTPQLVTSGPLVRPEFADERQLLANVGFQSHERGRDFVTQRCGRRRPGVSPLAPDLIMVSMKMHRRQRA